MACWFALSKFAGTKMKLLFILFSLLPYAAAAQLSYDTLNNRYAYQCNCFESLIVQGTPVKTNYKTAYETVSVFQINIDTTYYGINTSSSQCETVFVLSNNIESSRSIMSSNLFVLRNCVYCDTKRKYFTCRPRMYYEMEAAVKNETQTLKINERADRTIPCITCEAIPPYKRGKKFDIGKLDDIEKYIARKRKCGCR